MAVTPENAVERACFKDSAWVSSTTVPPGTQFKTRDGLVAVDEAARIAFDFDGEIFPIRESTFEKLGEDEL